MTGWLELPHGQSTWGETGLDAFTRSDCEAAMNARRQQHRRTRSGKSTKALVSESTVRRDVRTVKAVLPHAPSMIASSLIRPGMGSNWEATSRGNVCCYLRRKPSSRRN